VLWLAFRLGTASEITWRQLWPGAAVSAVIWTALQYAGTAFVSRQIAQASPLYGTFAIVLGLIAWLYLQAQLTLYAVEINVVRAYRLWPRSLAPPPYTEQDRRAFRLHTDKRSNQRDIAACWPGSFPRLGASQHPGRGGGQRGLGSVGRVGGYVALLTLKVRITWPQARSICPAPGWVCAQ